MAAWIFPAISVVAAAISIYALVVALAARKRAEQANKRINAIESDELTPAPRVDWRGKVL